MREDEKSSARADLRRTGDGSPSPHAYLPSPEPNLRAVARSTKLARVAWRPCARPALRARGCGGGGEIPGGTRASNGPRAQSSVLSVSVTIGLMLVRVRVTTRSRRIFFKVSVGTSRDSAIPRRATTPGARGRRRAFAVPLRRRRVPRVPEWVGGSPRARPLGAVPARPS